MTRFKALAGTSAIAFVVLLGIVSMFADITYEGARSVTGPYLGLLGASATVVGFVAGAGEFLGYALRVASGYFADRTRRYWAITIFGYCINLLAVPAIALAGSWEIAAALMITERIGKAVRTPARDVMLSYATTTLGRGWGFGLHEALDQTGAVLGPLVVAAVLFFGGSYNDGFAVLLVPALIALGVLVAAWRIFPHPRDLEPATPEIIPNTLGRNFWLYMAGIALIAAGFADFPLIAYHFGRVSDIPELWIPGLYAFAMGVDAVAALVFGRLYDRIGLKTLVFAALISACFAPLVFFGNFTVALIGMGVWGVSMGAQESIMRAAVAGMAAVERRGTAYGVFNATYGLAWFLGSILLGVLYDISLPLLVTFSAGIQLLAVPLLVMVSRKAGSER